MKLKWTNFLLTQEGLLMISQTILLRNTNLTLRRLINGDLHWEHLFTIWTNLILRLKSLIFLTLTRMMDLSCDVLEHVKQIWLYQTKWFEEQNFSGIILRGSYKNSQNQNNMAYFTQLIPGNTSIWKDVKLPEAQFVI